MAWATPKTDWDAADYFNYGDLNRIESNTQYINDELTTLGYSPTVTGVNTTRTNTYVPYYDEVNRIEQNIQNLASASSEPIGWLTPKTTWVSVIDAFDYGDANRLESNLLALYTMLTAIIDGLLYCGDAQATICGKGNTIF